MIIAGFGAWHNDVVADYDTFFPEGVGGTVTGASLLFFGFIGFDEVMHLQSYDWNQVYALFVALCRICLLLVRLIFTDPSYLFLQFYQYLQSRCAVWRAKATIQPK